MFQDRVSASRGIFFLPGVVCGAIDKEKLVFSIDFFGLKGPRLFDAKISDILEVHVETAATGSQFRVLLDGGSFIFQPAEPDLWKREFQSRGIKVTDKRAKEGMSSRVFGYASNIVGTLLLLGAMAILCGLIYALFHI